MPSRQLLNLNFIHVPRLPSLSRAKATIAPKTQHYLELESDLGSQLFGPVPEGVDRKFFHSTTKNTWIWHENGTTIRYEVRPHGVFKKILGGRYTQITGPELENFRTAARTYLTLIKNRLYT